MGNPQNDSVTCWIQGIREGDEKAAQRLWELYFTQLVRIASSRLGYIERDISGEDVALSAINSVFLGLRRDRYPELSDRSGLWPLLVTITARKAINAVRKRGAKKRSAGGTQAALDLATVVGNTPSPEFSIAVMEELDHLSARLGDQKLRRIALKKLEGFTNQEIAEVIGCSIRTVIRKLERVRSEWQSPVAD